MKTEINLEKKQKITELKKQIKELLKNVEKDITQNYIKKTVNSGAISQDLLQTNNYVLAKLIVTAYFNNKKPFYPLSDTFRKELKNLEYFI